MAESPRLIDAHCHVNFNAYRNDADDVIRRCLSQGVGLINVGTQIDTSRRAVELAETYDGVWAIIGLHPIHLFEQEVDEEEETLHTRSEQFDADGYRSLVRSSGKVVGLGECGLDYFHVPQDVSREEMAARQRAAFRSHLDLALELDLPVMIHCREAHDDLVAILREYAGAGRKVRGDVHCFTGTWAEAAQYLELGLYVSFTGIVTFPPKKADLAAGKEPLADVARRMPLDRILVETDAPYLAPEPFRGKRNEPAYVRYVAAKIAALHGLSPDEMEKIALRNTKELFRLDI